MALTKPKKDDIVAEVARLLSSSKMTVVARYQGTTVKALQSLRKEAKAGGTQVKVVKNRLVIKALEQTASHKNADVSQLSGMLLYAFNSQDEVAPAQSLNAFAKNNPTLEFVGAFTTEGKFIGAADVKALAGLPSRDELIAQTIAQLLSPVHDVTNALSGNLHALLDGVVVQAK